MLTLITSLNNYKITLSNNNILICNIIPLINSFLKQLDKLLQHLHIASNEILKNYTSKLINEYPSHYQIIETSQLDFQIKIIPKKEEKTPIIKPIKPLKPQKSKDEVLEIRVTKPIVQEKIKEETETKENKEEKEKEKPIK